MFNNKQEVIEVNEYGLFAFCAKIQELIKQGYEIDLTSNVRAPMSYGTMFVAYMVPTPESEVLPTELVVEKPQSVPLTEEKVQDKPASEPKVPKVSRKSGAAE
jgi:hypothetical protein